MAGITKECPENSGETNKKENKSKNIRSLRKENGDKVIEFAKTLTDDAAEAHKIIGNAYVNSKTK